MSAPSDDAELRPVAVAIAVAFLSGDLDARAMAERARHAIGDQRDDWLLPLAREMAEVLGGEPCAVATLVDLVLRCDSFTAQSASARGDGLAAWDPEQVRTAPDTLPETPWTVADPAIAAPVEPYEVATVGPAARARAVDAGRPSAPALRFAVAPLEGLPELRDFFGLHWTDLAWYADVRSYERDTPPGPLRHYSYRWLPKRRGGARLLEAPKPMLRFFQRRILHDVLDHVPPHPAAHGFRRACSVHSFATPHVGRRIVIRIDLESFFASVRAGRVHGLFRRAGYPDAVAHVLTGFVTNAVPTDVRRAAPRPPAGSRGAHRRTLLHLSRPHLPQGAPTSPALANLAAFALDRRLTGLATAFGASYTRYADDLAFSGGHRLGRHADTFVARVDAIVRAEGFRRNEAKTRVMGAGERQALAGLVVNERAQPTRTDYDRLRAVLHDAAVNGPGAANRDDHPDFRAHLLGRIGWTAAGSPTRQTKLTTLFASIDW